MFIRESAPEAIEIEEITPRFDLTEISLALPSIAFDPIPDFIPEILSDFTSIDKFISQIADEFNRTPITVCTNADPQNGSLISLIPAEIWIEIFSYLDIKSLIHMMISCKKMADLANDNRTRERLYKTRENHRFFKMLQQPALTPIESFVDRNLELSRLQHYIPPYEPSDPINLNKAQQVYNDNPPGKGFVMR